MDLDKYNAKPNKTINAHNEDLLKALGYLDELGYIPSSEIFNLIKTACIYHDYGKANAYFQKRVNSVKRMPFDEKTEVAHNVLSLHFLPEEIFTNVADYYRVGNAILNHHDYCDTLQVLQDEEKKCLIEKLLSEFSDETVKISRKKLRQLNSIVDDKEAILIKGFLHKCDYSASAEMEAEYPNYFLVNKLDSLGFHWNALQEFCKENTDNNVIAVAQTGMGKTEGGLHWIGNNKGFFILPIRTAINAIYDRIRKDILKSENIEERVALLHSGALEYYNHNLVSEEMDLPDYYERGKKLSMPLTICTMDQLFDFVFKYNGYEMKLTTLSYSKIVLDEIQMYSPELLAYLICGIEKINKFGGKVAIVTATLPPFVKDEIVKALEHEVVEGTFVDDSKRHNVKIFAEKMNADRICTKYRENIERSLSNKILVVCNTVKKAQEIYTSINEQFSDETIELHLLHSRFTKEDRAKKEQNILSFGKTYDDKEELDYNSGIWISTSIVEASLDIDFDYLFTELSDLNALFQRFGRCNRKGVKSVEDANCFVFTEVDVGKNLDITIYRLSKTEIEQVDGIIDEKQKLSLINHCFTRENVCRSEYFKKYLETKDYIDHIASYESHKNDIKLRDIMSADIIPSPVYEQNEDKIQECLALLSEEQDPIKRAKLSELIRNYIVSIPAYIKKKENTCIFTEVNLSKYVKIPVMECEYDNKLGFREIDYSTYKRETKFL